MEHIEVVNRRRGQSGRHKKWLEFMSPEAQVAMRLASEDTRAMKIEQRSKVSDQEDKQNVKRKSSTKVVLVGDKSTNGDENADSVPKSPNMLSREPSYSELFERNGSARMRRDMTDESYSEESDPKRALGGGKVESAMEIVELVNHDQPDETASLDEHAIEELKRINSVDKCAVWMEATEDHQSEPLADIPERE